MQSRVRDLKCLLIETLFSILSTPAAQQRHEHLEASKAAVLETRDMEQQATAQRQSLDMQVTLLENQKLQLQLRMISRTHSC